MIDENLQRVLNIVSDLTDNPTDDVYRKLDEVPRELWEGFVFDVREEFRVPALLIDPEWTAYDLYLAILESTTWVQHPV